MEEIARNNAEESEVERLESTIAESNPDVDAEEEDDREGNERADDPVMKAYAGWLEGDEGWELPTAVLDSVSLDGVLATGGALVHIFIGHNFRERRRFDEAARCYLAAFKDDRYFDECDYLNEQIEEATGVSLDQLCAESEDLALREIALILERWQNTRERLLRAAEDREKQVKKIEPLCWESAAAVVMAHCSSLELSPAKIHLLLFYAEGLCMRHFKQRLFRNQLFGEDDALQYAAVDMAAADALVQDGKAIADIKSSLSRECARLVAAVSAVAPEVAGRDIRELLEEEPLWLASGTEPISARVMMNAFCQYGQAATFQRALYYFENQEVVESEP